MEVIAFQPFVAAAATVVVIVVALVVLNAAAVVVVAFVVVVVDGFELVDDVDDESLEHLLVVVDFNWVSCPSTSQTTSTS